MSADWTRYSCQMSLPDFGEAKQQRLLNGKTLIVGLGGLGCPAAQSLVAAGVGTIGLADYDVVSENNLHRQFLYRPQDIGRPKTQIAFERLSPQNPDVRLLPLPLRISSENALGLLSGYDLVVDCSDNFETKYLLSDTCVDLGLPLVYAAIFQFEGQVAVFNILNKDGTRTPNYRDLFPQVNEGQIPGCAEGGVIPTLAAIVGNLQANEVLKYLTGTGELLSGKLLLLDARTLETRIIGIGKHTRSHPARQASAPQIARMPISKLRQSVSVDEYLLVDVRTLEERNRFHIGGIHVPLASLPQSIESLDLSRKIVFYCQTGSRSDEAVRVAQRLRLRGDFLSLEGGLRSWQAMKG